MLAPTVLIVIPKTIRWDNQILAQQTIVQSFAEQLGLAFPIAIAEVSGGRVEPTAHVITVSQLDFDVTVARHDIEPAEYYRTISGKTTSVGHWIDPEFGRLALKDARIDASVYDFVAVITDRDQFAPNGGTFGITSGRWSHVFPYAGSAAATAKSHIHPGFVEHEFVHQLESALREHGFELPDYHGIIDEVPGHEVMDELSVWFDRAKDMLPHIRMKRAPRPPRNAQIAIPTGEPLSHLWSRWNAPAWSPPPPIVRERRRGLTL